MGTAMKAAVYLRVSSTDGRQDEANQEPDCARLCAGRGWEPVYYREHASGAKRRPEWARVVEAARRGHVGAVVFWALDRTGRTRTEVCRDIEALAHYRVHVASVQDAWLDQPPGPFRDLMLQIVAWFAEGERQRLIERTRAGIARARQLGKRLGRPPKLEGERLVRFTRLVDSGMRPGAIGRALGVARSTAADWKKRLTKKGAQKGAS